jgi:hypothetical protein
MRRLFSLRRLTVLAVTLSVLGWGIVTAAVQRRSPGPPAADPRVAIARGLAFAPTSRDLGTVEAGRASRVSFAWRWAGPGDLRVLSVETGCSCVVAAGLPGVIPEGASGTLVLDVAGRTRPGPFAVQARVVTDRPPDDVVRVEVRGFVGSAVAVDPPAIDLGRVAAGAEVVRSVTVRPPPGRDLGGVLASLEDVGGTCTVRPPAREGVVGADVRVVLRVPAHAGPFHGHVEVRAAREGVWRVPVRGDAVVGALPPTPRPLHGVTVRPAPASPEAGPR